MQEMNEEPDASVSNIVIVIVNHFNTVQQNTPSSFIHEPPQISNVSWKKRMGKIGYPNPMLSHY